MDLFGVINVPLWAILMLVVAILIYVYGTLPFSYWSQRGIPGPKPTPFFGNSDVVKKIGMGEAFSQWKERYGRVVGCYLMRRPMLLVNDVNMLKKIMISEFNNFSHRGFPIPRQFMDTVTRGSLLFVEGITWKRIRNLLTPAFTSGRLREKAGFINQAADKAIEKMLESARKGEKVDAMKCYKAFSMDVILSTLFSVLPKGNLEVADEFNRHVPNIIRPSPFRLKMFFLSGMFPFLGSLLGKIGDESKDAREFYTNFIQSMMERRKEDNITHADFLQNMIAAESDDSAEERKKMSFDEIVSQSSLFFIAGNDTSSNTLMFMSYLLAKHQDVQEKIVQEIKTKLGDEELNYDSIQKLTYLDACIKESLRLYPATVTTTRLCIKETTIDGITIPAGAGIYVPIKNICYDSTYYPEPEKFNPNRFVKGQPEEITDVPFIGFGFGPRNCIGMRLALYQIAMAMAAILKKIRFVDASSFTIPPSIMFGIPPLSKPIMLDLEPRV